MSDDTVSVKIEADASGLQEGADVAVDSSKTISDTLDDLKAKAESGADGLDKAGEAAGTFGSALLSAGEIAKGAFEGILGADAIEKVADNFKDFFESATIGSFDWAEGLTNLSVATGMTTDELQIVERAAQITGTSFDSLGSIVNRVSRVMLEFSSGSASKQMLAAADALKIDPTQYTSAFDLLEAIEDRIKSIGDLTLAQRGALEQLFGRGVLSALPFIEKLRETEDEMRQNNELIGTDSVKAQDDAAESINRLGARWDEFKHTIGGGIAEFVNGTIESFKLLGEAADGALSGSGLEAGGANPKTGFSATGARSGGAATDPAMEVQPQAETAAQAKKSFEQEAADYEANQKLIMAEAGDTAEARMAYEENVLTFLKSHFDEAAKAGVDLSSKIAEAAVGMAQAQNAAARESAEVWKQQGEQVQASIREAAKSQNDALDEMFSNFKDQSVQMTQIEREKWDEIDATQQQALRDFYSETAGIAGMFEPATKAGETLFDTLITGTKNWKAEIDKTLASMLEGMAKSGINDALFGAPKNSPVASVVGVQGEGGGITGQLVKAFQDSAVGKSVETMFTTVWQDLTKPLTTVFSDVFTGLKSVFTTLFGSAAQGVGGAAAGAVASGAGSAAAGAAATAGTSAAGAVTGAAGTAAETTAITAQTAARAALTAAITAQTAALVAEGTAFTTSAAAAKVANFSMAESAAGLAGANMMASFSLAPWPIDMGAGGAAATAFSTAMGFASFAAAEGGFDVGDSNVMTMLHPREMVLPADIASPLRDSLRSGSNGSTGSNSGSGGDTHVHMGDFHVHAIDSNSFKGELAKHAEFLAQTVTKGIRRANNAPIHQMGKK